MAVSLLFKICSDLNSGIEAFCMTDVKGVDKRTRKVHTQYMLVPVNLR